MKMRGEKTTKEKVLHLALALATVLTIVAGNSKRLEAYIGWCPNPSTQDFYDGTGYYVSGSVHWYPWWVPPEGHNGLESFDSYRDGELIESSQEENGVSHGLRSHLTVTSGELRAKYVAGFRRAYTDTYDFRMLATGLSAGRRVKWTDGTIQARFRVGAWQPKPQTSDVEPGVKLFGRYRSPDDLYVASLRRGNKVVIQKKLCGVYTELKQGPFLGATGPRTFATDTWYTLRLSINGSTILFEVDGVRQLQVDDATFSWGTFGIRTDFANVYLDDLSVH